MKFMITLRDLFIQLNSFIDVFHWSLSESPNSFEIIWIIKFLTAFSELSVIILYPINDFFIKSFSLNVFFVIFCQEQPRLRVIVCAYTFFERARILIP